MLLPLPLAPAFLLAACVGSSPGSLRGPPEDSEAAPDPDTDRQVETDLPDTDRPDTDRPDTDPPPDTDVPEGPCPPGMTEVDGAFCIDTWEATLEEESGGTWIAAEPWYTVDDRVVRAASGEGRTPQGYISGAESKAACEAAGKRLCTSDEWLLACRGPANTTYPYGNAYDADACNDTYGGGHPVIDYFGSSDVFDSVHMNDPGINQQPGTLTEGGAMPGCVSSWGVYDMHGNVHEWVADTDGTFRGGFYADAAINGPGCTYRTGAHGFTYHDYSTGFRCCSERR